MGIGYNYKCKRCGRKYSVTVGMPYLYPQAYRELHQQIWEYRQGLQPARAFRLMPRAAVKAERIVLYCENEGHWLAGYDCTLYLPNDPESIPKDEVPFPDDLEKDYHVAWEYKHRCGICRKYLYIGPFIRNLQEMKQLSKPIPVSCFTATAKQKVVTDICEYFAKHLGADLRNRCWLIRMQGIRRTRTR